MNVVTRCSRYVNFNDSGWCRWSRMYDLDPKFLWRRVACLPEKLRALAYFEGRAAFHRTNQHGRINECDGIHTRP